MSTFAALFVLRGVYTIYTSQSFLPYVGRKPHILFFKTFR